MWACPPKCYRSHPPCSCVCHESHNLENSIPLTKIAKMPVPKQECYFLKMVDEDDLLFTKLGTFKKLGTFFLEMYLHIVKSTQMPYFYRR